MLSERRNNMGEERMRVLNMLASGKISVEEAESLLAAIESPESKPKEPSREVTRVEAAKKGGMPKFFRVTVESTGGDNVDVRIPFGLLKAGIRLSTLMPPEVASKVSQQLADKGIQIDLNHLKKEDIDELLSYFSEMEINVDSASGDRVRVFCE